MLTIIINVLFALVVTLCATDSIAADMHWGDLKKDHCTEIGKRQYSAILWDIPGGLSWENACQTTVATLNGKSIPPPNRCKNTGNMWGEWDIPDSSCGTTEPSASKPSASAEQPSASAEPDYAKNEQTCLNLVQNKVAWDTEGHTAWNEGNIQTLCKGTNDPSRTIDCFKRTMPQMGWKAAIEGCADSRDIVIGAEKQYPSMPAPNPPSGTGATLPARTGQTMPAPNPPSGTGATSASQVGQAQSQTPPAKEQDSTLTASRQVTAPINDAQVGPTKVPGAARDIDVKNGAVWIVGTGGASKDYGVYKLVGGSWEKIDGGAVRIAVDNTGNPWIVNSAGTIYRRVENAWTEIPGIKDAPARDIAITKNGDVWVVTIRGTINRLTSSGWSPATSIDNVQQVIALPNIDTLQIVDIKGKRWTRESATSWVIAADASGLADKYNEFAVDLDGTQWGIDATRAIWKVSGGQ